MFVFTVVFLLMCIQLKAYESSFCPTVQWRDLERSSKHTRGSKHTRNLFGKSVAC